MVWTEKVAQAFENAKEALAKATLLHAPIHQAPPALTTNASEVAAGGMLSQWTGKQWEIKNFKNPNGG